MSKTLRGCQNNPRVLATDLDGTFIPLSGDARNLADLETIAEQLRQHDVTLTFVTGRHLESVERAIADFRLPAPDWIICDVGTTIHQRVGTGDLRPVDAYRSHLDSIIAPCPLVELREMLGDLADLRLQEVEKQGRFKLSYYAPPDQIDIVAQSIQERLTRASAPYSIIASIDPFKGDGLVDLLPEQVSKAYALRWWVEHAGFPKDSVVFAGDSGNDLAAFLAGYRTIIVGNADRNIARDVQQHHQKNSWQNRLCLASGNATSGVLEGCRWFGMFPENNDASQEAIRDRLGAVPIGPDATHFRVWAPRRRSVQVELRSANGIQRHQLQRHANGYFTGIVSGVTAGDGYQYCLDHSLTRPDPASRFQPDGVHGNSQVVDSRKYAWQDSEWPGVPKQDLIIYEMHIGTFTEEGTFAAARQYLGELQQLGVTAVEIMPVAQSPGRWNWGYDGVNFFAVRNSYGTPDQFRALVDDCHALGIAVILDVVYNHLGPEGNYLADFAPYFSHQHHTPWGDAFDFDGDNAGPVRRFIVENALYWLDEFHLDGLRLDAVHFMFDDSEFTILDQLREAVADFSQTVSRRIHSIAEANVYDENLLPANDAGKSAYDAIWCDDLMHSVYSVAAPDNNLTARQYLGSGDLAETLEHGFVYKMPGQVRVTKDERPRLQSQAKLSHLSSLVVGLQTHDSVGNHPHGRRIHHLASVEFQKSAAALFLLYPSIPLIFMGEERAADSPFHFFVDFHDQQLRKAVDRGRAREYPRHVRRGAISPTEERAFYNSKCLAPGDEAVLAWYQSLIALRKRWQGSNVLDARYLNVECHPRSHVFAYRYDVPGETSRFVLTRLQPPGEPLADVTIQISAEILLDSHGIATGVDDRTLVLQPNRAIVGAGNFEAAAD